MQPLALSQTMEADVIDLSGTTPPAARASDLSYLNIASHNVVDLTTSFSTQVCCCADPSETFAVVNFSWIKSDPSAEPVPDSTVLHISVPLVHICFVVHTHSAAMVGLPHDACSMCLHSEPGAR